MDNGKFFGELRSLCTDGIDSKERFNQVLQLLAGHRDRCYVERVAVDYVLHYISEDPISPDPQVRSPFHTYYAPPINNGLFCAGLPLSLSVTLDCYYPSNLPPFDYKSFFQRHPLKRAQALTLVGQDFHFPYIQDAFGSIQAPVLRTLILRDISLGPDASPEVCASHIYTLLEQFPSLELLVLHENYYPRFASYLLLLLYNWSPPHLKMLKYDGKEYIFDKGLSPRYP